MDALRQLAAWEAEAAREALASGRVLPAPSRDGWQSQKREQRSPQKKPLRAWILPKHLDPGDPDLSREKEGAAPSAPEGRSGINLWA